MVIYILLELIAIKSIYDLDSLHDISNLNFASHLSLTKIHFLLVLAYFTWFTFTIEI
jgi:hypothetical protein